MERGRHDGLESPPAEGEGELARGSSIGRYLIVALVGRGGMGEVYAAYDPELDRKVAVKLLRAHTTAGTDPSEGRARLLREAQAIARLSDPNVVVVFDVGTFQDRVFLAMEFVDGSTLGYWSHTRPRSWREVVTTFSAAGRGLAAAHRAGIVHRDFKPDNVMIDQEGKVRVMDFGLARAIGARPADPEPNGGPRATPPLPGPPSPSIAETTSDMAWPEDAKVTRNLMNGPVDIRRSSGIATSLASAMTVTGAMMGTPAYMAPEQFRGKDVDARSDQFSFCVSLYEALYGERPFEGATLPEQTAKVLRGIVRQPPANTRVPSWLRRVLLRGLRVDRDERYASMDALLEALGRDPTRVRRRWALGGSVAGLVAALTMGLVQANRSQRLLCQDGDARLAGVWEVPLGRALSARKQAIQRAFLATGKRYAADSFVVVMNALDRYVTDWSRMHRDSCEATHTRGEQSAEVLDLRTACLNDRLAEAHALVNVFSDASGDVVSKAAQAAQALRPIEQCADITALRAVVRPPEDPEVRRAVADTRAALADVKALTSLGKYRQARQQVDAVIGAARRTKYDPLIAEALLRVGELQIRTGALADAEKTYEEAAWLAEGSRHDEVSLEAAGWLVMNVGYSLGRPQEGERWARFADAVQRRLGPGHDILSAWRANNLAVTLHRERRYAEAAALFQEALTLKTRALGDNDPDVALSMANVAYELFQLGRLDEAIQLNQRSLDIFAATVGIEHPLQAFALSNGAEFLNADGRPAEAFALASRAIVILEREVGAEHPDLAPPLTAAGISWMGRQQAALARPLLERALKILEAQTHPDRLAETRFALAQALGSGGGGPDAARALTLAVQARADLARDRAPAAQLAAIDRWLEAGPSARPLSMR